MAEENVKRKLAAILYADVVGYSRLTGADEEGTHRAVAEYLDAIAGMVSGHDGRVVHYAGDAVLADFGSVVSAVKCAIEIQEDLAARNADDPDDRKVQFRIGVNLGDVIVARDDIYGDGVNVAARLESLADPGGICVSRKVLDEVQGKIEVGFEDMGPQQVKNIAEPVQTYRVDLMKPTAAMPPPPLPDKPSIAVLPFDNMSSDPELDYLADGLTEDLMAALAKVPELFVIARNSTATYKGKAVKVQEVAGALGVRYVLEGSVQKSGDRLRITPQFIDAASGHHLWAERYDRPMEDIFVLQDEIVRHVLIELQVRFTEGDGARIASRGTNNLEAWLLRVQGSAEMGQMTREGNVRARELLEAAHRVDPKWARPLSGIAFGHYLEARYGWSSSREDSIARAIACAERAIAIDPEEPFSYMALRGVNLLLGNHEKALSIIEKAASLAPNDQLAIGMLASTLVYMDEAERAVEVFENAVRLGPKVPKSFPRLFGIALQLTGRTDHAIAVLEELARLEPEWSLGLGQLAAAYAGAGRVDAAQTTTKNILERDPSYTASRHLALVPFQKVEHTEWLRALLVKAGLPE